MKILDGGVTSPKGFSAAGLRAGIKPGKTNKDMAMILSEEPAAVAGKCCEGSSGALGTKTGEGPGDGPGSGCEYRDRKCLYR